MRKRSPNRRQLIRQIVAPSAMCKKFGRLAERTATVCDRPLAVRYASELNPMERTTSRTAWARRRGIRAKSGKTTLSPVIESYLKDKTGAAIVGRTKHRSRPVSKESSPTTPKLIRVLVAEDNRLVRDQVSRLLLKGGLVVRKVGSPAEIDPAVSSFKPQVLVLDDYFEASGTDYREVMADVVLRHPGVRVVVTTRGASTRREAKQGYAGSPAVWGAREVAAHDGVPDSVQLLSAVMSAAAD